MIVGAKRNNKKSKFIVFGYVTKKQEEALKWYEERRLRDKENEKC